MNCLRTIFCCGRPKKEKPPETAFRLRLAEAQSAYQALNSVLDIVEDERQLRKLRHAQKLTKELHYDFLGRHKRAPASPRSSSGSSSPSFTSAHAPLTGSSS